MKNKTMKFGMIAGLLLFSSVTFGGATYNAGEEVQYLDVKVKENEKNIVYINFGQLQGKNVKIRVFNNNGVLLKTVELDKNNAVLKTLDIQGESNNIYSLDVVDTQMIRTKFIQK